jgi:hypothetical protein
MIRTFAGCNEKAHAPEGATAGIDPEETKRTLLTVASVSSQLPVERVGKILYLNG